MTSSTHGQSTSEVEVVHIDTHGIWVFVRDREYFLDHREFPWFRQARIAEILNVEWLGEDHLHWPDLDVDLCVESLSVPQAYPLIYE